MIDKYIEKLIENLPHEITSQTIELDLVLDGGAFNGSYLVGGLMFLKEMEKTEKIAFWGTGRNVPVVGIKGTGYIPGVELPYPLPLPSFDHAIEIAEAKKEISPKEKALSLALIKQQMDTELATVDGYYATAINRRESSIQKHKKEIQDIERYI